MLINSEFDVNVDNVQQALDIALTHEGSEESWMTLRTPELDSNLMGVELSLRLPLKNLVSYFDHCTKVLVFIQPSLSSQGEHIDYEFSVLLPAPIFNNDIRRVCPLFIYLVIWAPKDYIAGTARYFYGVQQVKVDMIEVHISEFSWNNFSFMTQESKAQKQRPVGLDNPIDRGNISDTTCFSISRDIEVFENPEHESQKQRPAGQNDNVDPPKLELSDLGNEFSLESFPFPEDADSDESRSSSRIISETTMNLVEALALAPLEPRTEKEIKSPLVQSGSADLESTRSNDDTGNLSMESLPLLDSMLDMAVESHMAHCEVTFCRLQGWSYSDY